MKLTKEQLKQIIKEELKLVMQEEELDDEESDVKSMSDEFEAGETPVATRDFRNLAGYEEKEDPED
jgi:hypothetical protein